MTHASRYAKAIIAALGALATWGATAGADETYTDVELWTVLGAVVTALAVLFVPNTPPTGEAARDDMSEQGATDLGFAAVVAVFAALAVYVLLDLTDKL